MAMQSFRDRDDDNDQQQNEEKLAVRSSTGTLYVDYKNADALRRYLSANGKIQGRKRSGLTAREQRIIVQAIKRARYMGLLPFTSATL